MATSRRVLPLRLLTVVVATLLGLARPLPHASASLDSEQLSAPFPTDQLVVRLSPASEASAQALLQPERLAEQLALTAGAALTYVRPAADGDAHILRLDAPRPPAEVEALARQLAARPDVLSAEPDLIVFPLVTPTDPLYTVYNWHLQAKTATSYSANLPPAWDITTGATGVPIAVIDSGGLLGHPDLVGRSPAGSPGYDLVSDLSRANDGDGRDADPSDPGSWVTVEEAAAGPLQGCPIVDSNWHGSHVAGTIGASANNGLGITGINWIAPVLHIRALGKCGGSSLDVADAMRWAAGLPVNGLPANPNPARVLNLSLGGSGTCPSFYQSAIDQVVAAGAVVVVAAGNNNVDATTTAPGNCARVITVAATRRSGYKATYSNFGSPVEIAAPGGDNDGYTIASTVDEGKQRPTAYAYAGYAGTSMAAPHVAGIASLMLAANPTLTTTGVLEILQATATPFPSGSTCIGKCGAGIVDGGAAVEEAARRARTVGFGEASRTIWEDAGTASVPVSLSVASSKAITVTYTVTGTANLADHSLRSGSLTFGAGQKSASLSFTLVDDDDLDPDETLIITLGSPGGTPAPATLAGTATETITIKDDDVPQVRPSSEGLSFEQQTVGTTSTSQTVTLENPGLLAVTISAISLSGNEFARAGGTCPTILPATLASGASCTLLVSFTPSATGSRSATLTVVNSGHDSPTQVSLTGEGFVDRTRVYLPAIP